MPRMETLGLADSTPRSDNRLKSLFWPSIQNGTDVDYLGTQGYWVCSIVAVISFVGLWINGEPITGAVMLLFFYLGGVGVRERSRYAALAVLVMYALDSLVTRPGVVRILIGALLLSNLRATWIASNWQADSEAAILPPRMAETLADKFADRLPQWLWPKLRILYYIFAGVLLVAVLVGLMLGEK
jgi:hypothetical protein